MLSSLLNRIFFHSVTLITQTFLAFYFWQAEKDLTRVLFYSLPLFALIPLGSLIGGFICDRINPKIAMMLGIWLHIIQLILVIVLTTNMPVASVFLVGAIGGIALGLKHTAMELIAEFEKSAAEESESEYYATQTVIITVLQLVIPLSAAFVVSRFTNHYFDLFTITLGLLITHAVIITFSPVRRIPNAYHLKAVFTFPGTNRDKMLLTHAVFFEGISEGVTSTILPVIILFFASSLLRWSYLNTGFLLFGIVLAIIFKRIITDENTKLFYALGAFLYATVSVFFVAEFSFVVILVFLLTKELMDVLHETSYESALDLIVKEDPHSGELYAEYRFLIELASSAGRVIPILGLLLFGTVLSDDRLMRFALLATGLLPLIAISIFGKTRLFSQDSPKQQVPDKTDIAAPVVIPELPSLT